MRVIAGKLLFIRRLHQLCQRLTTSCTICF